MKIAILGGTGKMGTAFSKVFTKVGYEVIIGSRDIQKSRAAADEIKKVVHGARVSAADTENAAKSGEVIIIALPYRAVAPTVIPIREAFANKLLIDITNPFDALPPGSSSAAEENLKALGGSCKIVAAFKTNFWKTLDHPTSPDGIQRDVLVCANDEEAKQAVFKLIEQIGFRAVDCGDLKAARTVDLMVPLMIDLDRRYKGDNFSSWKFLG